MSKLTATAVKQAKATDRARKLQDGGGMYLLINATGKYWRYDYRFAGKRKTLALGVYPEVSLKDARERHQSARQQLGQGIDPSSTRRVEKLTRHLAAAESFEAIALEWFERFMAGKSAQHSERAERILKKDLFPVLGRRPVAEITAPELLAALRRIESRGALETAHRAKQTAHQVFRYAVATGRAQSDPAASLTGVLKPRDTKHLAAITDPAEVGKLLVAIDGFSGTYVVRCALKISALLFQRPGEIRHMEWSEIDWDGARWELAAEKMKMRVPHIVPLCKQALALLQELHSLTGRGRYVFPSARGASRCLSENSVRVALRSMGYDSDTMSAHGFRAMARTILDEVLGYRVDWIEHQLAHAVRDANGRAYNRTSHMEGRREMMQGWADYLDNLKAQAKANNVVTLQRRA